MRILRTSIAWTLGAALIASQIGIAAAAPLSTNIAAMKSITAAGPIQVHWRGGWGGGWGHGGWGGGWGWGPGAIAGALIGGAIAAGPYGYYGYPAPYYGGYYGGPGPYDGGYYGEPYPDYSYYPHAAYYGPYYGHPNYGYYGRPYGVYHRHYYGWHRGHW